MDASRRRSADELRDEQDQRAVVRRGPNRPQPSRLGEKRLWRVADVAEFLGYSHSWVYDKAESGLMPVIRFPGSSGLRFDPDEIRAYARGEWKPPLKSA